MKAAGSFSTLVLPDLIRHLSVAGDRALHWIADQVRNDGIRVRNDSIQVRNDSLRVMAGPVLHPGVPVMPDSLGRPSKPVMPDLIRHPSAAGDRGLRWIADQVRNDIRPVRNEPSGAQRQPSGHAAEN